ncbi:paraquat-inducible protein A [Ruegeria sp. 2012CJ41-6]|uniref:Paraquat-inducible protein A n=1 Tax=Ruegeria spongiae TaxID=2942209 RepID=A0ABT0Q1H7_9RHOB|nr:paraquat-inducible protein A [Ruegeria spongiae]MCL6283734.1 paraquat-inducible protein A [Ruegeria spongiae]
MTTGLNYQNLDGLIACPHCDLLHELEALQPGQRATCSRCHSTLITTKSETMDRTLALALASAVLMAGALCFPFLGMSKAGLERKASIVDVILAFSEGWYVLLGLCVLLFVVVLPMVRAALLVYTIWPLRQGRPALPHAKLAFAWAEALAPWAMTEIFIIGTAVALIKIGGLATISFGTSFWLFCVLVLVIGFQNASVCRWTIWSTIRKVTA